MYVTKSDVISFSTLAEAIWSAPIAHRANKLGGYGARGEVIYESAPANCPSVLTDTQKDATVVFMSNGSVDFLVKNQRGMEIRVLQGSFDHVEKREIGIPSGNAWIAIGDKNINFASIVNPQVNVGLVPFATRVVKIGDPERAIWYFAEFKPKQGIRFVTALRYSLKYTNVGPALLRDISIKNLGATNLDAALWTYYEPHGTQKYAYDKSVWYDAGMPISMKETVIAATTPWCDYVQIKRLSTEFDNVKEVDATCDYADFVGNTAATALLPDAVKQGKFLSNGAGRGWNRFVTPTIAAAKFMLSLKKGEAATVRQSLLYITDEKIIAQYRKDSHTPIPSYQALKKAAITASKRLIKVTPDVKKIIAQSQKENSKTEVFPFFEMQMPYQPIVAEYANSSWIGVNQLYEQCRSHGVMLADGIEVGTRDRGQDMWPKMKEDPGLIRKDLVHVMSLMYQTCEKPPMAGGKQLTLVEKLHGMFPRQYPSVWRNRKMEVANDNRPYTDSSVWLIDSLEMYIRETGDISILNEVVQTVRLTNPEQPAISSMIGCENTYTVLEVAFEIFNCFDRHMKDSPYGLAQIMGGDWLDSVDAFGTSIVGDLNTIGHGRGVQIRLSAQVVIALIKFIDLCETPEVMKLVQAKKLENTLKRFKVLADEIRKNIMKFGWEDSDDNNFHAGFIDSIHEFKLDGATPNYANGEIGYALGSMRGDCDGIKRRLLPPAGYCLDMLLLERPYLTPIKNKNEIIQKLLRTIDRLFYDPQLGLLLLTKSVPYIHRNGELIGRLFITPPGCAENGEYHHGQMFAHMARLQMPGEADTVLKQFSPIISAMRDEKIGGPFETGCCSYQSEKKDPHFAQGMYFGLSGSVDWLIEFFQSMAGLELNLANPQKPNVRINPKLPSALRDTLTFKRIIHVAEGAGYRQIPFTLEIKRSGDGKKLIRTDVVINGKEAIVPEIWDIKPFDKINIQLTRVY